MDTPRLDAELLLSYVLGESRTHVHARPERVLSAEQCERFADLLARREAREPLPYLVGCREFLGLRLEVSPAALIPRQETETLVEAAAARLSPEARVLDVGAGSGCVALGLACLRRDVFVVALEPSPGAAVVCRRNAAALGFAERVRVVEGWFPADAPRLGLFDAVVSNPPYIPSSELFRLQPEVSRYEPRLALDGGPDGLAVIRSLVEYSPELLRSGGLLAMEIGAGQREAVVALLRQAGDWDDPAVLPDLGGIPRVLLATVRERTAAPRGSCSS